MKRFNSIGCAIAVLSASALLINTASLSAQDRPRGGGPPGQRGGGFGAFQEMSEEQREAMRQMGQETREIATQVREARMELNDAVYAEKVDETLIKQKAAALAKRESELAVAQAKAFDKVRTKFTSEQIQAMKRMGGLGFGFGAGRGPRGGQ